ncbi:hypothetical protein ACSS6N_14890 [Peribacillus frigoritolerans]
MKFEVQMLIGIGDKSIATNSLQLLKPHSVELMEVALHEKEPN